MKRALLLLTLITCAANIMAQTDELTSYLKDTYGKWHEDDVIQLYTGDSFALGPQQPDGSTTGTWKWTGPNGYQNNNREVALNNVTGKDAGIYTVTNTALDGKVRSHAIRVYVDGKLSADEAWPAYAANTTADMSYEAFQKAFLLDGKGTNGMTYYREGYGNSQTKLYCWTQGLVLLMLADRYHFRGDESMKPLISKVLDAFSVNESGTGITNEGQVPAAIHQKHFDISKQQMLSNWTWNFYNDDLLWMSLPYVRAYFITGEKRLLAQAKWTFDYFFERGWSEDVGGGVWWSLDNDEKSGLSNNPGVCLAAYLYEATGDETYLRRAKQLFGWVCDMLRNDDGSIDEGISKKQKENGGYPKRLNSFNVYNQGTFVEGAAALYRITGDEYYFDIAKKTVDYVMLNHVDGDGIISRTKVDGTYQSEFARGVAFLLEAKPSMWKEKAYYGRDRRETTYYDWLRKNADAAWDSRDRTYNLSDCEWAKTTVFNPNSDVAKKHTEVYVSSVVMLQVVPEQNPWDGGTFKGVSTVVPAPTSDWANSPKATGYVTDKLGERQTRLAGANIGETLTLRAESDIEGEWTWTGPNDLTATGNQITISKAALKQTGVYRATCTAPNGQTTETFFVVNIMQTVKPIITPYVLVNNAWQEITKIKVVEGQNISIGPQVKNISNSESDLLWHWDGPNGFAADKREISLTTTADNDTYTCTFTDGYGRRTSLDFLFYTGDEPPAKEPDEDNDKTDDDTEKNDDDTEQPDEQQIPTPTASEIKGGENGVRVWACDNTLFIEASPFTQYKIIDLGGRVIRTATTKRSLEESQLPCKGIFVVLVKNKTYKVFVQ